MSDDQRTVATATPNSFRDRFRRARAPRPGAERGATLVEYVLFVSMFVLVSVQAVAGMNQVARTYFQDSASRIGQPVNSGHQNP